MSYDEDDSIWPSLIIGFGLGAILVSVIMIVSSFGTQRVDLREFGERLCESQNLSYDHYEWIDKDESMPELPRIVCKVPDHSVYDGVVVLK